MDKYLKAIAEGGPFDTAEAIRALAKQLVAKGLVLAEQEEPEQAKPEKGKKK